MARILIVEDDEIISKRILEGLTLAGHRCIAAFDGDEALELIGGNPFDLILLDVMLPKMSGFDLIGHIKHVPVIFLTARDSERDRIAGLDLGADDYIVKPFSMNELLARVRVVLRRTKRSENFFPLDDLLIDFDSCKVYRGGEEIKLTAKEFGILDVLITNRNSILTREQILNTVWSYQYDGETSRNIDVYIVQLRKKLGLKDRIKAVYGVGYRLEV